jgi:hypothetical protein
MPGRGYTAFYINCYFFYFFAWQNWGQCLGKLGGRYLAFYTNYTGCVFFIGFNEILTFL